MHVTVVHQRLRQAWDIGRVGSRIRDNIDAAIRLADVLRDGDFITVPGRELSQARTPVDGCARTVDQVPDAELTFALVNYVRDAGTVSEEELSARVARLFGWNRRGNGISARIGRLVADVLSSGRIASNGEGLLLPDT